MSSTRQERGAAGALPALALALCMVNGPACAQAPSDAARARTEVSPSVVEQKTRMVEKLLFDSPAAARVAGSQSEDARRHLNNARELHTHAKALVGTGQLRGADALLNEAIWEIGRAQQLAPDPTTRLVAERARYGQLRGSVDALLRTYEIGLSPGQVSLRPDAAGERNVARAIATSQQARQSADAGQFVEANRQLEQALSLLLKNALSRLDGQTLVYDRRFASTRDEFGYELERHRSLDGLVPLAVLEFRPSREAQGLIERYLRQARALRERAESAAAGDHAQALSSVNEATEHLQRALQAAGLSVPQAMDNAK